MSGRSDREAVALLTAQLPRLMAGDEDAWQRARHWPPESLVHVAEANGVLPLIAARRPADVPPAFEETLQRHAVVAAARDVVADAALRALLQAWRQAAVRAVLIKGADLAHAIYDRPDLRSRVDSDVLVDEADFARAAAVLERLGYEPAVQVQGDLLMYQAPFTLSAEGGTVLTVDLHRRVMNPQSFASVLTFEELWAASEPRPSLGTGARGLSRMHALLLACVHRVAHHYDDQRLIWTHDIHLLSVHMTSDDWAGLSALAAERHVASLCVKGLLLSRDVFGTTLPLAVLEALERAANGEDRDAYGPGHRHAHRVLRDFQSLPTWRARLRLARQHAFPSRHYMRAVYAPGSRLPLLYLYVARACRGARRWVVRS